MTEEAPRDDATVASSRREPDRARPTGRRAPPDAEPTQPATSARPSKVRARRRATARPPDGVDAAAHQGEFGDGPEHYYPRTRVTRVPPAAAPPDAGPTDAAFTPTGVPTVLTPAQRSARDARLRRRRRLTAAALVSGAVVTLGAAAAAIVALA